MGVSGVCVYLGDVGGERFSCATVLCFRWGEDQRMPNSFGIPSPIGLATNQQPLAASGGEGDCSTSPPQPDSQACGSPTQCSEVVGGSVDMR